MTKWHAPLLQASAKSVVSALVAVTFGCTQSPEPSKGSGAPTPTAWPGPEHKPDPCDSADCSNVIDAVVIRMLADRELPIVPEEDGVLCRRMAIDLTGIVPTVDELETQCAGKTATEMAEYFMNKPGAPHALDGTPPYVFVNRRWWADQFQYQLSGGWSNTFYAYILHLDDLVEELYRGDIGYDVFARRALASPAFARRFGIYDENTHDLPQIARQAIRVFLGREALPSEAADFGNLWRGWQVYRMYNEEAAGYWPECVQYNEYCYHLEMGLDGDQCAGANLVTCTSITLGAGAVVPSVTPSTLKPGSSFVSWLELSETDREALETPGKLLVDQPQFAEAAADRALAKYLGWWKAGSYEPDFDVPAVRDALAKKLVADGYDVRKMEREIVTSVLYRLASARGGDQNPDTPIWAFGPTKLLYAEAWLDSMNRTTQSPVWGCDFRYINDWMHQFSYPQEMPKTGASQQDYDDFYVSTAAQLGGCPVASHHTDPTGLVPAIARRVALARLCKGAFVPTSDMNLEGLARLEFQGIGREPSEQELSDMIEAMSVSEDGGCDPADLAACDWPELADSLCMSLFASATFNYY